MSDIVKTMLAVAGLPASDAEIEAYTPAYEMQRLAIDALYEVPEARYVDPALRFRAQGRIEDWAD
jgi:hypothetical protein